MGRLYAGTSGFAYPTWKPEFYPADVPQSKFLAHYARRLNSVEINYTYHRLPSASTLEGWFRDTEPGFVFALKAHQKITHILRLKDAATFTELFFHAIDPLRSAGRLGPILFQLPPNLRGDAGLLKDFLALAPGGVRCALEFRHDSWMNDAIFDLLRQHNAALCLAESEKFQAPDVLTADFVYLRLRMPSYSEADVAAIRRKTQELIASDRDVFVYFKHEETPAGALWAESLLGAAATA